MMDWVQSLPIVPAIAFLYVVIWLRAGGTYLLGRGARRAANRGRVNSFLTSPRIERATAIVNKWGAPVVALSFLTVGFQTAANAAAGLTGMPLRRYLPALATGGLAWAVIYATVGLVAFAGWVELFLHSPWAAVAVLALVVLLIFIVLRHRRRTGSTLAPQGTGDEDTVIDAPAPGPEQRPLSPADQERRSLPHSDGHGVRTP